MRSQAKASSAGSNSNRAQGLGSLLLVFACAAACLLPASAVAAESRPLAGSFGPDGTSSSQFGVPGAIGIDQGTHDIYVADYELGTVQKFDQNAAPSNFSALGSNEISGFGFIVGEGFPQIAVDSASHNFYVGEFERVKAFEQSGEPHEFTAGAAAGSNELHTAGLVCGVAVDANGVIYVSDLFETGIHVFNPDGEEITTISASGACNLAVDSHGSVYASHFPFFEPSTQKFTPSEFPVTPATTYPAIGETIDSSASFAIAVDPSNDELYLDYRTRAAVYDDSGAKRYEFAAGIEGSEGIAVDGITQKAYAADTASKKIQVFGPAVPLPEVTTEDADVVITATATLHGKVNPEGKQLTDCRFDFVPDAQFKTDEYQSVTPSQQAPCVPAAASLPPDSTDHAVSADLSGLDPGTTYHFRLVAATAEGGVNGLDRVFTTAIGPPVVGEQSVDAVGALSATVGAEINPKGAKTTYHVEYGPTASYGQSTPESQPIGFGADDSDHTVSVQIGGLAPGTAYHFRFVAISSAGTDAGDDVSFATYSSQPSFEPCSNEQFRVGLGARLPDCRAYEQATPIDKHGANAQGKPNDVRASSAGDRVTFYVPGGLPTSGGSSILAPFLASRNSAGWSSDGLLIATGPGQNASVIGWSDDLAASAVRGPSPGNALYLRDSDTAAFELANSQNLGLETGIAAFSGDPEHLILESNRALAPGAVPGKNNLYDLDHGALTLAARIPAGLATSCDDAGGPACVPAPEGSFAGPYHWQESNTSEFGGAKGNYYTQNTISRDGSRVFFTAAGSGQLYVREDGTRTTRVSASQRTVPDPNGEKPAAFMAATPDGSKVFFTSCEKLTDDSTAFSTAENACTAASFGEALQGQDLYSYDVDSGELTDLTVDSDAGDPKGAAVQGVLGASDDGSYVYFVANGVLAPGGSSGECAIGFFGKGACNLYVSHDGATKFIAPVHKEFEGENWAGTKPSIRGVKPSRVAADGSAVLFSSVQSLTGYDNASTACGNFGNKGPCEELFRYSAPDEELTCVSCNPAGLPPGGPALVGTNRKSFGSGPDTPLLTRNLSADGNRAFFDSPDPLVSTDTNGVTDVYEWEAEGSGSCETAGGCLYVLSGGSNQSPSYFADASADGEHVFLFSEQQLVPGDRDRLYDVYDAGIGAGLAAQHALAPPTCTSIACQANPAPPPDPPTSSATFSGPGNAKKAPAARKCPKGKRKVRRAGKVRCQKAHKATQHKRHSNRGGSK